jgi:fused signal recognition particle receptor
VQGVDGGDPAAVAFDATTARKARGVDLLFVDTAGRLHNKHNLMEELKKVKRTIQKADEREPGEVWLVLDAVTGQNGLEQAKKFHEAVGLTGVIVTKLDGTAKGGIVVPIVRELGVPVNGKTESRRQAPQARGLDAVLFGKNSKHTTAGSSLGAAGGGVCAFTD